MEYEQAVSYIHSLLKFGIKPGLERMEALLAAMGNPERALQVVHVAGTNGKGSTCNMLANILSTAGYKTGLFTSPYVVNFRERIQINHEMIPCQALADIVETMQPVLRNLARQGIQPTEFEVITALAFVYFAKAKCDVVVLEVGLGGRLDSTNVVQYPLVSVITNVAYDHMSILGNTLTEIAAEKCGIIKSQCTTVSYPCQNPEALAVIEKTCKEKESALLLPNAEWLKVVAMGINGTSFTYRGGQYHLSLLGEHQVWNALAVIETANELQRMGLHLTAEHIHMGIANTKIPARMELLSEKPPILLDGGHNEDCAKALDGVLNQYFFGKKLIGLIGMMEDKAYDAYLSLVAPHFSALYCTAPDNPRALSPQVMTAAAGQYCSQVIVCTDTKQAVAEVMSALKQADGLVVCGSFYLAAEVRPFFKK